MIAWRLFRARCRYLLLDMSACQYPPREMPSMPRPGPTGLPGRASASRIVARLDSWSPYWEPQAVVAAAILLDLALPARLTVGPTWLLPSVEGVLLVVLILTSPHPSVRHSPYRRYVTILLVALVSAVYIYSLAELIHFLLLGTVRDGRPLVYAGAALWGTNVLVFGLWYFELDRGGPTARALREEQYPDFLFPQMTDGAEYAQPGWMPRLIDYLYVSFTNATAFSPTDTMPLSAAAKWIMSLQALASLTTVGLVVARAVNILQV
jgi:hypothetical protein